MTDWKINKSYINCFALRALLCLLFVLSILSTGCSAKNNSSAEQPEPDVQIENNTSDEGQKIVREIDWVVEPRFAFTEVKEFTPYVNYSGWGSIAELLGYPDEWEKQYSDLNHIDYTGNAIEVVAGNKSGVYDYYGRELYPVSISKPVLGPYSFDRTIVFTYLGYTVDGGAYRFFSNDFTSIGFRQPSTEYSWVLGEELRIKDWSLKIYLYMEMEYIIPERYTDYPRKEIYTLVPEYNDEDSFVGYVIMDGKYNLIERVMTDDLENVWIVNRMIRVKKAEKYTFQSVETGEVVSDYIYDDAKNFMDGYAPVKRNEKWGFIDMNGDEVTDIMFDDVSCLYQGNAYVSVDGVYGIINLVDLLNKGYEITPETCKASPEMIKMATEAKRNMLIPIGTAEVNIDNLNVRRLPSAKSDLAAPSRSIPKGRILDVYALKENEGYIWCQIDENMWIANSGEWVTYKEN